MEVCLCTCMHTYSINYGTSMLEYRFFGLVYVLLCFCPGNGYPNVFYTKLSIKLMLPNWLWLCYVDFYFGYLPCILLAMIACDCYVYLLFKLRTWLFMGGFYPVAHCNDSDQLWRNDVYVFSDVALVIISSNKILNYKSLSSFSRGPLVVTMILAHVNAFWCWELSMVCI
mgnify:CR=1 FL=1